MFRLHYLPTQPFVPSDLTSEVKSFIENHKSKNSNADAWHREMVKDLIVYTHRPDFIYEVFRQTIQFHNEFLSSVTIGFVENLTDEQIFKFTTTKAGNYLLNKLFGLLDFLKSRAAPADKTKLFQLNAKIEKVRFLVIANDRRPLIADMVKNNDGLYQFRFERGLDDFWLMERNAYRFGVGHDGEHILGNKNASKVKAIAGLEGTVLTYFQQLPDDNYAVYILLKGDIVLVLKDLFNLSPLVLKFVSSTKEKMGVPKFIDKSGKPIRRVKIGAGELIGYTKAWEGETNRSATGLHFNFVKYKHIQQYRDALGRGESVMSKYPTWFIVPCGTESPVRCQ